MSIEVVLETNVIEFERELDLEQVEDLLYCVAESLPAGIRYTKEESVAFHQDQQDRSITDKKLRGSITSRREPFASDAFECVNGTDPIKFRSLNFSTTPGYNLSEYRPEVIHLWRDVRSQIEVYFSINKTC